MGYQAHCVVMEELSRASGEERLYHQHMLRTREMEDAFRKTDRRKEALVYHMPHIPSSASTN